MPPRPGASTPCGRRRPPLAPRGRSAPRGRRRARSLRGSDGLALVDEAARPARAAGSSQTRPWVSPVSAPTGFVAALKITLRHCGPRASATAVAGIPRACTRRRAARPPRAARAAARTARGRVALDVPLHVTRLEDLPGRERRAADHALDVTRDRLLVADAVLHRGDGAAGERRAVAATAASVCIAFVATIPKSQDGSSAASRVACGRPTTSPAPESRSPPALIASTCACESRTPRPRRRRAATGSPRTATRRPRSRRRRSSSRPRPFAAAAPARR